MIRALGSYILLLTLTGLDLAPAAIALLPRETCTCGCCHGAGGVCCCRRKKQAPAGTLAWFSQTPCGNGCRRTPVLPQPLKPVLAAAPQRIWPVSHFTCLVASRTGVRTATPHTSDLYQRPPPVNLVS